MAVRPIDGNKLIEWFSPYLHTGEPIPADVVIEYIKSMPTITPPNEWVSVEERLPERGKDVLLYFGEESRISVGGRYDVGGGWYAVIVNEYETICDTSPRFWMPLPAPPEKEDQK